MDILELLKKSGETLYPEDLDFFETELATGEGYSVDYCSECRSRIAKLRAWNKVKESQSLQEPKTPAGLFRNLEEIVPSGADAALPELTPEQVFFQNIVMMREDTAYKVRFKQYIAKQDMVNESFLEKHFSFFHEWEMGAIVSTIPLNEAFLEKYFGALDHDKIARHQLFSEDFFIKHFSQLDYNVVLKFGKNDWRKKENRSRQLDVFLRLKGVKI